MSQNIASTITSKASSIPGINWLVLSRVLVSTFILTLIFSSLYYFEFKSQFEAQRTRSQSHDEQLLNLTIKQSDQQFKLLQKFISTLNNVNLAVQLTDTVELRDNFGKHWAELQKIYNINFIGFYSLAGKPLATWPQQNTNKSLHQPITEWINTVKQSAQELSGINCNQTCNRYLISPLIFNNLKIGYQVLALAMSDTLNDQESKITGILSPAVNPEASSNILVFNWGYSVNGISIQKKYQSILQEFAETFPDFNGSRQVLTASINHNQYELSFYPLKLSDKSLLIILDNISAQLTELQISTLQFSLITFLALLTLQLLLLLTIKHLIIEPKKPASESTLEVPTNLDKTTPPNLEHIKQESSSPAQNSNMALPAGNNLIVNSQLDSLKQYNEDINLELTRQMIHLSRERDMLNKILDNSQAIIMQLHKDGTIASINTFGEKFIGYSTRELAGRNFVDLYPDNAQLSSKDLDILSSITHGDQQICQHESNLIRKNGKECVILWLHTKLEGKNDSDIQILSTGHDITQRKKLEKNMGWLLNHDSLTSLFNRRRFEKELDSALEWARNQQKDGCLLTIDLDNFKDINDSCGHKVGDTILRKVAATLLELMKQIDSSTVTSTARLGGDEFAIILRNFDEESACALSERIIKALNHISHLQQKVSFQLSSNIGIATFFAADNNSTELLSNANYARNQAKIDGQNQYHIFKTEHSHLEHTHHRMIWRKRIEGALKNDRFILYFQPILNIQQYKVSHYETLIRMQDENNKPVSPDSFIHIAEKFGLIQQIDNYIIASAIAKQGELRRKGHDVTLTINLSAKAFDDPGLFNKISQAIQLNHANPEHLVFEITETGAVSNIIAAEKMMTKIQSLGCQFALDDFGIGFSSFHYLRKLPFEYVKIDGSFVADLANNSDNKVLVQALSEVAIGFNKLTVAEFVDSRQTLEILRQAKVNYAQGYFIGKPSELIPVETPDLFYSADNSPTAIH